MLYSPVLELLSSGVGNIVIFCECDHFVVMGGLDDLQGEKTIKVNIQQK